MKTTYTFFSFVLLTILFQSNVTSAQKWSVGILGVYNIAPMGSLIASVYNSPFYLPSYRENIKGSYGEGISYGVDVSYKVCPHVGLNLEATMLNGKKINYSEVFESLVAASHDNLFSNHANDICINPGVTFTCNEEKKIQPFLTASIVICVYNKFYQGVTDTDENHFTETQFMGGWGLGYKVALGASYKISTRLAVSLAINAIHLTCTYNKAVVTQYTESGVNKLSTLTVNESQTVFKDEIIYNSSYNGSNSSPDVELKPYLPFSTLGLQLGLKYSF